MSESGTFEAAVLPAPRPGVAVVELDGGCALASDDGALLRVSDTAALVWDALGDGGTVDDLVTELADAFGAPAPVIDSDVRRFLWSLRDAGLLVSEAERGPVGTIVHPVAPRSKVRYLDTAPNS